VADKVARVSAIEGHFGDALNEGENIIEKKLSIKERRSLYLFSVGIPKGDITSRLSIESCIGFILPDPPISVNSCEGIRGVWLQPNRWMLVAEQPVGNKLESRLRNSSPLSTIRNITTGRVVLRLSGNSVRDILAKGCSADLHPRVFRPETAMSTLLGHFSVMLESIDKDIIDLYITRSFGLACLDWLKEARNELNRRSEV